MPRVAKKLETRIVNYADDFVILCRGTAEQARAAMEAMMGKLKLTVNQQKTRICRVPEESFDFLGYTLGRCHRVKTGEAYIGTKPSKKRVARLCEKISQMTQRKWCWKETETLVGELNLVVKGWGNYFRLGSVSQAYRAVDVLVAQGKLQDALDAYQQGLAIAKHLAEQDKSNSGWQRDLSVSYEEVGDVLVPKGKLQEALDAYQQSLKIRQTLAEQDKSNSVWQRDLSVSYNKVGYVLETQGKLHEALDAYQQSLKIPQTLAEQDKSNLVWQRELAVSYEKVGDVLMAQGKLQDALDAYQQDLAIAKRLVEQDKSNSGWQHDLAVSYNYLGNVLVAQGKLQEALDACLQGMAILKRLAEQDKSNSRWQHDLIVWLLNAGTITAKIGGNDSVTRAEDLLRTGLNLAELYPGPDRQNLISLLNSALWNLVH